MALITSRGTLDKSNSNTREQLASTMDLIGAIRLPESTFTKRALTTVTTDILFLQRRSDGQSSTDQTWVKTGKLYAPNGEVEINQYFIQHPEMILGKMVPSVGRYGEPACQLNAGGDLPALLESAIQRLPADRYHVGEHVLIAQEPIQESKPVVKESGYWVRRDGTIWRQENGQLVQFDGLVSKRIQRIKGLLRIRDAARAYLDAQTNGTTDSELDSLRADLNRHYDRFVAEHGPINLRANQLALSGDPDLPFLMAMEDFDATTEKATKTSFFHNERWTPQRRSPMRIQPQTP